MVTESQLAYILACPQEDGKIAVLCRSSGTNPGPAYCPTKTDALKLKTNLTSDPRGKNNHRAMEIIKSLLIYKLNIDNTKVEWEAGSLWGYLDQSEAACVESKTFWQ